MIRTIDLTECSDDNAGNAATEETTKCTETNKSDLNQATTTTTTTTTRQSQSIDMNEKMEREESPAVKGGYSGFTNVFGVFVNGYRNSSRRFSSLEAANQSASEQFQRQIRSNGDMEETEIMSENPFHGWTTINDCAGTLTIEVRELDITQCSHPELKVIAKQETTTTTHQPQSIDMNEESGGIQRRHLYKELQNIVFKSLRPEIADLKYKDKMPILKSHWNQIKADPEWRTKLESIRKQYYLSKEAAAEIRAEMKAKERKERAERRKKEMEREESPAVKGEYSEFTDVFGVFINGSCSFRLSSMAAANQKASNEFKSIKRQQEFRWKFGNKKRRLKGDLEESEIYSENPFQAWTTINDGTRNWSVRVRELDITQCRYPELEVIAKREDVDISAYKSKKDLVYVLKCRIQHKKHRNNGEALNIETCLFCKEKYPQKYKEYQDELDRNPVVIENRKINKMYQKSMNGSITENRVSKEYGYSFKQLKQGIIDQELHWSWKNYYGTTYRVFWRYEIERWQLKLEKMRKEKEKQEQRELKSQRKRTLSDVDLEEKVQSISKKRKLNESKENDVDCEEGLIDYMGVPPQLRKHKWLYDSSNALQQADREKIIRFMFGSYTRSDVSTEDVVLDRKEGVRSVLRLIFQPKAGWKKLTIRTRVRGKQ